MNFISDLWNGRLGLAKTYWFWGVLVSIPLFLAFDAVGSKEPLATILLIAATAYFIIIAVGIWRAATLYKGAAIWAILAKLVVLAQFSLIILGVIISVLGSKSQTPTNNNQTTNTPTSESPKIIEERPIFLVCKMEPSKHVDPVYSFEFIPSKNHMIWLDRQRTLKIKLLSESKLVAGYEHGPASQFLGYTRTNFVLNRITGNITINNSRDMTPQERGYCETYYDNCDQLSQGVGSPVEGTCQKTEPKI